MNFFRKSLSEIASEIKLFPKLLVNVKVKEKPELATIPEIQAIIKEMEEKLGAEGRVLVRYSGMENLCWVMVEGRNSKEVKTCVGNIAKIIERILG